MGDLLWRDYTNALQSFLSDGGPALLVLLVVAMMLCFLFVERLWFRFLEYPAQLKNSTTERRLAGEVLHNIAESLLCLNQSLPTMKTLVMICPMVGLFGTVSGMIHLFDVLSWYGTGNPRLMASGVALATLPTMAGMVVAVTGLLMYTWLHRWSIRQQRHLSNLRNKVISELIH